MVPLLSTYPSIKVWVAGCSAGEELYSLAILFREEGLESRTLYYATDINSKSLDSARLGIYSLDRIAGFTANYQNFGGRGSLSDYYTAAYGGARFDPSLKKNVVFSDHSLVTDSVFAEVQFISCRNVLIYFDRPLQSRVIGLFKDSLARRGFLGLGSKESLRFTDHAEALRSFRFRPGSIRGRPPLMDAQVDVILEKLHEKSVRLVCVGASAGAIDILNRLLPAVS